MQRYAGGEVAGFLRNLLAGGPDAAEAFLRDWFGPPEAIAGRGESASDVELPAPLRDLHALVERWPRAVVQNDLLSPPRISESRLVFYVENQGAYEWAVELGTDVISGRQPDAQQWVEEEPTLESFSLELLVFEAIKGAPHGAQVARIRGPQLLEALRPLTRLPHGAWRWPGYPTTFHAADDRVLACAVRNRTPDDPEAVSLFIGARDPLVLAYLDDLVDESWEYYSRRDRD